MPQGQASDLPGSRIADGVYLLFSPGDRPDRRQLLAAIEDMPLAATTHDPAEQAAISSSGCDAEGRQPGEWLELLQSGMTFDLLGLSPGPSVASPTISHRLACDAHFDPADHEAIALFPGPHLADGANSLPIVRAMLDLACGIARRVDGVRTICWSPARSAVAMPMFCQSVEQWLEGGPFPALGLTSFAIDERGAMRSEGLAHFLGQELSIAPELASDRIAATRLGARLVHDLVASGPLDAPREFIAEDGLGFLLSPSENASQIEVRRM